MNKLAFCHSCGGRGTYQKTQPVDNDLKESWQLSNGLTKLFNIREGFLCGACGVNVRAQGLAKAILNSKYGYGQHSLKDWVEVANKRSIKVCELNSCHKLHEILKDLKKLTYAEYGTKTGENIENLSYKNNQFDVVLHSETLEHVSNPKKAMEECRRVLKPGGMVLFTVPVIWSRKTRRRATIKDGKINHILHPSYHGLKTDDYLVFFEYGRDVCRLLGAEIAHHDWRKQNYVFSSSKDPSAIGKAEELKLRLQQTTANLAGDFS